MNIFRSAWQKILEWLLGKDDAKKVVVDPDIKPEVKPEDKPVEYTNFDWAEREDDNSVYIHGIEIRCLANDNMESKDIWITKLAKKYGAIESVLKDGVVTLTAKDFKTENNNLKFAGWRVKSYSTPLTEVPTVTIAAENKKGVTRAFWRTIK